MNTQTNVIDHGAEESARLQRDYQWVMDQIAEFKAKAEALPQEVNSDAEMAPHATLEKAVRDFAKRIHGLHDPEKQPHLRRGQAVDRFFFGAAEQLVKAKKNDPDRLAETIMSPVNAYMKRKLEAERKKREEAEAAARAEQERIRKEREDKEREARELEAKAARARNEDNRRKAEEQAAAARAQAERKRNEEAQARSDAAEAAQQANAKPADMVGTRVGDDAKVTMVRDFYARAEDHSKLDRDELWPFVSDKAKEEALARWAKTTNYARQMEGAAIGYTERAVTK